MVRGSKMAEAIDRGLIEQCKNGDMPSFEKLFYLLKDSVYNTAFRFLGDHQWAEDITQEVFISAWTNLGNFRMESSIHTWIYRITANQCYDFLKREGRIPSAENSVDIHQEVPSDKTPSHLLTSKELGTKIEEAFCRLSPESRLVLTLKEIEELPYKEIADILDCTVGAAKMRTHRARLEFRKIINRYLEVGSNEM
jgi:RNA polymerase sigma-70 factor (ECF subfamily)